LIRNLVHKIGEQFDATLINKSLNLHKVKYYSHLNTAVSILEMYKGQEPFTHFLRTFFSQRRKYGSRDRKLIAQLCYSFFRLGKAGQGLLPEDRIMTAYFLCAAHSDELLHFLKPGWLEFSSMKPENKLLALHTPFSITDIFPWKEELSEGIEHPVFCSSFLIQPSLFLRIRPGKEKAVLLKLTGAAIPFHEPMANCIELPNSTSIEELLVANREVVVQDYSSQLASRLMNKVKELPAPVSVWDCCAASGGKSILAWDTLGDINLTVSDIRESILSNLKKRFSEAGITNYKSFVANLQSKFTSPKAKFDLVIADVPCTGSGTWSRTPEQLYYFDANKIEEYAAKQEKITSAVIPFIKPGGYLLYITCSVFKRENEDRVNDILGTHPFQLIEMQVIKGYDKKADSMFAALLQLKIT
jgi:16S rRNA (cytosine967-C5)-methyltransferase